VDLTTAAQVTVFGLVWGGLYALTAHGLNLIYGVMKVLNIAHGEFLMLGAYVVFWLFTLWRVNPLVALAVAVPAMVGLGALVHRTVVHPLVRASGGSVLALEKSSLVAFFGVLMIVQNGALLAWTGDYRVLEYLGRPVRLAGVSVAANRLVVLAVALVVTLALHLFLRHTFTGKAIRAVSQDREAGMLMAVDADRIALVSFALGSGLAGLAGGLVALVYVITPTIGILFTVKAFTVMVVGGPGRVVGTFGAGLALGVAEAWGSFFLGEGYRDAIDYVLLVGIILLMSHGVLRRGEAG